LVLNAFQIYLWHAARNDSYADDTRASVTQPALHMVAHDKLTSKHPLCNGLRAFATRFCLCLSPQRNGSRVLAEAMERYVLSHFVATPRRHNRSGC